MSDRTSHASPVYDKKIFLPVSLFPRNCTCSKSWMVLDHRGFYRVQLQIGRSSVTLVTKQPGGNEDFVDFSRPDEKKTS